MGGLLFFCSSPHSGCPDGSYPARLAETGQHWTAVVVKCKVQLETFMPCDTANPGLECCQAGGAPVVKGMSPHLSMSPPIFPCLPRSFSENIPLLSFVFPGNRPVRQRILWPVCRLPVPTGSSRSGRQWLPLRTAHDGGLSRALRYGVTTDHWHYLPRWITHRRPQRWQECPIPALCRILRGNVTAQWAGEKVSIILSRTLLRMCLTQQAPPSLGLSLHWLCKRNTDFFILYLYRSGYFTAPKKKGPLRDTAFVGGTLRSEKEKRRNSQKKSSSKSSHIPRSTYGLPYPQMNRQAINYNNAG